MRGCISSYNRSQLDAVLLTLSYPMPDESAKSFESFYTLHDDFEPEATGGIRWLVNPSLVRSIECWCQHIHYLEPLDKKLIVDRTNVRQHFYRWFMDVYRVHQLDRETLIESLCGYLFDRLRLHPTDSTIRCHWIAFFMHRCLRAPVLAFRNAFDALAFAIYLTLSWR